MIALATVLTLFSIPQQPELEGIEELRIPSTILSEFAGQDVYLEAGIVIPPDFEPGMPVCFNIHGFGGSHRGAWTQGAQLRKWMQEGWYPQMLYVYPNANGEFGHTGFADSDNNGPWAQAFVEELLPAVEAKYDVGGDRDARFLNGHSSGGWSALWLQVSHPEVFGGAWATAPDPVDFRDMSGVDIYANESVFVGPDGEEVPGVRQGGEYIMTARQVSRRPEYAAQILAFNAAFSPRDEEGQPMQLFDLESGEIDRQVADAWNRYDIRHRIEENVQSLAPLLTGRLHVFVGTWDTVRLDGAVRLLDTALAELEIDASFVYAPERDHFDLLQPHPELWPNALLTRVHREMQAAFDARH